MSFWPIFALLPHYWPWKLKFEKDKKTPRDSIHIIHIHIIHPSERQAAGQRDRSADRWIDGWIDGWTDRQKKWHIEVGALPKKLSSIEAELKKVLHIKKICILVGLYNLNGLPLLSYPSLFVLVCFLCSLVLWKHI